MILKIVTGGGALRHWLTLSFLALNLLAGIRLVYLTPIGQVADEPSHIARTGALLHGEILGRRVLYTPPGQTHGTIVPVTRVNYNLMNTSFGEMGVTCTNRAPLRHVAAMHWSRLLAIDIDYNTVQYFPAAYLPGAAGIAFGRLVGQRPLAALFTGRLFMLLAYLTIGAAAITIARFGAGLIFAIMSLPMALSLGASFNQDGQLIAMSSLTAALLTLSPSSRLRWLALPVFTLVVCSKPPYGLLLFIALTPLADRNLLRRAACVALWAVPPLLWVILMIHVSLVPYALKRYHPGTLWPGSPDIWFASTDPMANLRVLLAAPARFITLPAIFFLDNARFLLASGIGELGWLAIRLSPWLYPAWALALCAAAVGTVPSRNDGCPWSGRDAAFTLGLVALSVIAVELAIYLSWDKVGSASIYGPQGRYFLPFLPFVMLALPRVGVRSAALVEAVFTAPAIGLALYDVVYLPALLNHHFCLG